MEGVGKIIFNELASRRAVILPGIGALFVENSGARMEGGKVEAPVNRVVFSQAKKPKGSRSVATLIAGYGVENDKAQEIYKEWLESSKTAAGIAVGEAGELRDGVFYASDELDRILNPGGGTAPVTAAAPAMTPASGGKKPLTKQEKTWLVLIPVFIIILAFGWWYFSGNKHSDRSYEREAARKSSEARPAEQSAQAVTGEEASGQPTGEFNPQQQQTSGAIVQATPTTSGPRWYVVGGVYSTQQNADKFISEYGTKHPGLKFEKMPYKDGKILVGIYGASSEADAASMRRQLAREHGNQDLWVYKAQ